VRQINEGVLGKILGLQTISLVYYRSIEFCLSQRFAVTCLQEVHMHKFIEDGCRSDFRSGWKSWDQGPDGCWAGQVNQVGLQMLELPYFLPRGLL